MSKPTGYLVQPVSETVQTSLTVELAGMIRVFVAPTMEEMNMAAHKAYQMLEISEGPRYDTLYDELLSEMVPVIAKHRDPRLDKLTPVRAIANGLEDKHQELTDRQNSINSKIRYVGQIVKDGVEPKLLTDDRWEVTILGRDVTITYDGYYIYSDVELEESLLDQVARDWWNYIKLKFQGDRVTNI